MRKVWYGVIVVVAVGIGYGFWWVAAHDPAPLAGEVAAKLRAADGMLYIVSDDPNSQQQLREFGSFADQVPTVDCKEQVQVCDKLQLDEMPTFIIGKEKIEVAGLQTPVELRTLLQKLGLW